MLRLQVGILLLGVHLAVWLRILLLHVLWLLLLVTGLLLRLLLRLLLWREPSSSLHWHLLFRIASSSAHG